MTFDREIIEAQLSLDLIGSSDMPKIAWVLAKDWAKEILARGEDPLKHTRDFEHLWINAGYPRELRSVGTLDDEVYLANGSQSDDQIRGWVTERLQELIRFEEHR